ncbi:receptor-type adenylate cyclase GRESAG 4, putative, partial [Trypanosoma vivax Y486]
MCAPVESISTVMYGSFDFPAFLTVAKALSACAFIILSSRPLIPPAPPAVVLQSLKVVGVVVPHMTPVLADVLALTGFSTTQTAPVAVCPLYVPTFSANASILAARAASARAVLFAFKATCSTAGSSSLISLSRPFFRCSTLSRIKLRRAPVSLPLSHRLASPVGCTAAHSRIAASFAVFHVVLIVEACAMAAVAAPFNVEERWHTAAILSFSISSALVPADALFHNATSRAAKTSAQAPVRATKGSRKNIALSPFAALPVAQTRTYPIPFLCPQFLIATLRRTFAHYVALPLPSPLLPFSPQVKSAQKSPLCSRAFIALAPSFVRTRVLLSPSLPLALPLKLLPRAISTVRGRQNRRPQDVARAAYFLLTASILLLTPSRLVGPVHCSLSSCHVPHFLVLFS